jgi:glycosyltransferase involved in cell wall biosynthesis
VSDELAARLRPHLRRTRVFTVINGIDADRLRSAANGGTPALAGPLRVGVFARLVAVKRVDLALDVIARARTHSGLPLVLHVFGDGPLEATLRSSAGAREDVVFHGNTDIAPRYMRQMDALLMTSSHEGLPVAVLEAMALSVPVVATRTGGIPAVLAHGECGWLADAGDSAAYAQGVIEAVMQSPDRTRRVTAALHRVEHEFSARRMAEDYRDVYSSAGQAFASGVTA